MPKVIDYHVVLSGILGLEGEVRRMIGKGWQPLGGPAMTGTGNVMQVMVKYEISRLGPAP